MKKQPKISVIGAGYVGLCTAVGFASKGYTVVLSEIDAEKANKNQTKAFPRFMSLALKKNCQLSIQNGHLEMLS